MKPGLLSCLLASLLAFVGCGGQSQTEKKEGHQHKEGESCALCKGHEEAKKIEIASPLDLTMKSIDGTDTALSTYKGKVVMFVNVASACGLTPQYEGLEKLYKEKKDKGFVILGFPANNFGGQEPGSDAEVKTFCTGKYGVSFPMFSKISVAGNDQHELYKRLSAAAKEMGGAPDWNFTKYLVNKEGVVVARFSPRTKPGDAALVKKIDDLLAGK